MQTWKKNTIKRKIHRRIFNLGITWLAFPLLRSCNRAAWRWFHSWLLCNWIFHTFSGNTYIIMELMRWFGWELTQVLWRIWFGNDKYGDPSKTQRSQVLSISLWSNNEQWQIWQRGAVIRKHIRSKISFEKQKQVTKDFSLIELIDYFNK